ncbi:integrase [Alkalihalobacillus alcalophilus ATCC 27647 = CGMCC 1.3604]|uniref:Integrase n=2 Tax=Alkalihalobacillus alcalophilus TaxID=1445 RepID=A0A4S4K0A0_ALKAL|nr:tyrosine-type recombinase/integrase [Alkalihalobacillus alcalophilus]MED1561829.1 tyrosine-type recombinase/integrase [Alkalihalobacillus alcalophilus]THG90994.1 integrase [Alkalihalobacillus alcalophilus ATCC 27647 = CGMCC 1.3604]
MSLFAKINQKNKHTLHNNQESSNSLKTFKKAEQLPLFIQEYMVNRLSLGYSKNTIQRYIYDYFAFFQFIERIAGDDAFSPQSITLDDFLELEKEGIEHYISYLALELENEPTTINRKISALQSLFDFLVKRGDAPTNPVLSVQRPKNGKREPVYLTKPELHSLLSWLKEPHYSTKKQAFYQEKLKSRDYVTFYLLMTTGLRISELAYLAIGQIDFGQSRLKIKGKGNKERSIPLSAATINVMKAYLHDIPSDQRPSDADDYFIVGYDFTKKAYTNGVSISSLQKMIKRTIEQAKHQLPFLTFKKISAHKLRHSFATELVASGTDVLTVQTLLGHESVSTTQVYAHVQQEAREKAIANLLITNE